MRHETSHRLLAALSLLAPALAQAQEPEVAPPQVAQEVPASYPTSAIAERREATVVVAVTVGVDGSVVDATVSESGGAEFDAAALDAIRSWRFVPARRGEESVASRILVPFRFTPPPLPEPATPPPPAPTPAPAPVPATTSAPSTEAPVDVLVRGRRPPPPRATSDFVLGHEVLAVAPHASSAELLESAPGVYVSRPEGDAVGHEIFLRGFDAEHGQDIELTVGPIPVNQPSHLHGQGYADLGFVPPEVVRSLRVTEGVYDPRQGDFAVAGSVDLDLGLEERGTMLRTSYGSFGTLRQLVLYAPRGEAEETFAAGAIQRSDGYGENRGSVSGLGIAQQAFRGPGGTDGLAHVAAYGARANMAGVLRYDDVDAGRVGFYDSYPDPTANSQSAYALRTEAMVSLERRRDSGARSGIAVWFLLTDFRLRENFTGYTLRSDFNPEWVGRGDLIEQENHDVALGARASGRSRRMRAASWLSGTGEVGVSLRTDFIDQAQNLLMAPQNETWDRQVDATIRGADLGIYGDLDLRLGSKTKVRGGARADALFYDVDDRLGNFIPLVQRQSHIVGFRRTASGIAAGPRATLEHRLFRPLTLMASYGQGYRSPQARQLEEGESAPYAVVRSMELGARYEPVRDRLTLTGAGYATFLSTDLAFDPTQGRLERIGPTSRVGGVVHAVVRPTTGLLASASATYVHATLDSPPPPSAEDPAPPFEPGQLLPYVPPVVLRADLGATRDLATLFRAPLVGRAGLGASYLSPRPLPFSREGDAVFLLDASASMRLRWIEIGVDVTNLLDTEYAASEFSFVSDWGSRDIPSRVPARHFAAGPPRTVLGSLTLHL